MVKKRDKFCPYCHKKWLVTVPIRARLKKYGKTSVKCIGCGDYFEVIDKPEVKNNDEERG